MAFKMKGSPMARNYGAPFKNGKELTKAEKRAAIENAMGAAEVETVSDSTKAELGAQSGMTPEEVKVRQKDALARYSAGDSASDETAENLRAVNVAAEMGGGQARHGRSWLTGEDKRTTTVPIKKKKK